MENRIIKFNYTAHKNLWKYMGEINTINEMKKTFLDPLAYDYTIDDLCDLVESTKIDYLRKAGFGEGIMCACFACDTAFNIVRNGKCKCCPIFIGCCYGEYEAEDNKYIYGNAVYTNYVSALFNYIDENETLDVVQKFASDIANAELDTIIIKRFNIKVI